MQLAGFFSHVPFVIFSCHVTNEKKFITSELPNILNLKREKKPKRDLLSGTTGRGSGVKQ